MAYSSVYNFKNLPIRLYAKHGRCYLLFSDIIIGNGGFKTGYKGLQVRPATYNPVALLFALGGELSHEARMHQELAAVPGVLRCYDHLVCDGLELLALQFCNRGSLEDYFNNRIVPLKQKAYFAYQAYRIVEAVHKRGIVHRDIKADNFFIDRDGPYLHIYLGDFGNSSKIDKSSSITENLDKQAFGTFLYELFVEKLMPSWSVKEAQYISEHIHPLLCKLLIGLLQKEPEKRPKDAEILEQLHNLHEAL